VTDTCPGCVGRGTGTHCCSCSRPIPEHLRTQTQVDAWTDTCDDCVAGQPHTHR
jgi:hypothetical protein